MKIFLPHNIIKIQTLIAYSNEDTQLNDVKSSHLF